MDFRDFCIRTVIAWQAFLFTRKSQETKNSCNLVLTNQINAYIIKKKGGVSLTTSSKIQEKILEYLRFLYKGIIINHNKKPSQPTLKRRFFKKKAAFFSWPGLGKEW